MKIVVLLAFCSSLSLPAAEGSKFILKTEIAKKGDKKNERKVYLDMNQDGKTDAIETYREDELVAVEKDTNNSGRMNEWTAYFPYVSPVKVVELVKKDSNGDGKVDRIENIYRDPAHNRLIITTEVDSKHSGVFDKKWTTTSKLEQKKDQNGPCLQGLNLEDEDKKINKLQSNVSDAQSKLNEGFITTELGYKVHQSCLENWGAKEFTSLLQTTMSKGFQCLEKLANDNQKVNPEAPNGAKKNYDGLQLLLQTRGISIVCGEKGDYNWNGTAGHASTSPADKMNDPKTQHPFISINPNDPKQKPGGSKEEVSELSKTLFHEQLHNLGIRHNEKSIEFPYTCETCCLPSAEDRKEAVDISCKICAGVYTGSLDQNYLKDMIAWGKRTYNLSRAQKAIIGYQLENPGDRFGLFAYADSSADIFSPVGIEMAKILKTKFSDLSEEEKRALQYSLAYADVENLVKAAPYAKVVAEAHIQLYYEQDENKVLTQLESKREVLEEMLRKKSTAQDSDKYVYEDVVNQMEGIMSAIWMKGYPDNRSPQSSRAYALMKETGFLK